MNTCTRCTRPVATGMYACAACIAQTDDNMAFIETNAGELDTTITRQDRVSAGTGGRANAETPLPLNLTASEVGTRLRNTLATWVRVVADDLGTSVEEEFCDADTRIRKPEGPICAPLGGGRWCTHPSCRAIAVSQPRKITDREMASWLRKRLKTIAHREWGPECFDELSRVAVDLGRAVDSPPPMISLGRCDKTDGCTGEIRARQEAAFTRCPDCHESYDIAKRKDKLLSRADHLPRTAASLARILTALGDKDHEGKPIVRELKWVTNRVQWKQLLPVGTDNAGNRTYRLGDARRLHDEAIAKDRQAAERKAARFESQAA